MLEEEKSRFDASSVIANIVWKILERGSSIVVTLLVNIFLARLLPPEEHGLLTMVLVFVTISEIFVTAGAGAALKQKKETDEYDFSSMFWINLLVACLIYLLIFFISPYISGLLGYRDRELVLIFRVLGLRIIIAAINSVQCAYVARNMLFRYYFSSTLVGKLVSGIVGVCLALLNCGIWALVAQSLSILLIETLVLWIRVKWRPKAIFSWKSIKGLYPFAWRVMLTSFVENITEQVRNLIIGAKNTSVDLAYYNKGFLFPSTLTINLTSAVSSVAFSVMSNQQENMYNVKKTCRYWVGFFGFLVLPMLVGMASVSDMLLPMLLTNEWVEAALFMKIACGVYASWIVEVPIREAIRSIGHAEICLRVQIIKMIISIGTLIMTFQHGADIIAYGVLICSGVNVIISLYYGNKYLGYKIKEVFDDMIGAVILSASMGIIILVLSRVITHSVIGLIGLILLGIGIYVGGAAMTHNRFFYIGMSYAKKLKRGHDE